MALTKNTALIFLGNLFSDKYLTKNDPPIECPTKITSSFKNGTILSIQSFHSSNRALVLFGIIGNITSYPSPRSSRNHFFQSSLSNLYLSISIEYFNKKFKYSS